MPRNLRGRLIASKGNNSMFKEEGVLTINEEIQREKQVEQTFSNGLKGAASPERGKKAGPGKRWACA